MNLVGGLIGSGICGALGAALWAGIVYGTNYEIGWIAWGIGAACGFGMNVGAKNSDLGPLTGILAVGVAVLAILAGKYAAVSMLVDHHLAKAGDMRVTEEQVIFGMVDQLAIDREAKGEKLQWPAGKTQETAEELADYPADVVQQARDNWAKLDPAERAKQVAALQEIMNGFQGDIKNTAFQQSFGPYDILWLVLASFTAYRIGANTEGD